MAASSYSFGISSMKPFISQTEKERLNTIYSRITPIRESYKPSCRYIRKIGIVTTTAGSMRVLRMKNIRSSLPFTGKRLKA